MQCQLWMGSLEPNMTESFIMAAFNRLGQRPLAVKVMRNKFTGEPAGYAFTDEESVDTMHKLNGKPIPGTFPVVRFRLNTASREARQNMQTEREFSVWVGDLSPEVDDYSLYRVFASKYSSIKTAKVILDSSGYTKGYGFVRFGSEDEQRNALYAMNGYTGLGSKPLKICTAVPKPKSALTAQGSAGAGGTGNAYNSGTEYNQYYDPSAYWQNYSAWSGYYGQGESAPPTPAMNEEFLDPELSLWDCLEASQWFPHEIVEAH
ncbi:tRNA selenocysteine associated protein (Secp43) [Operophtera brumata]|uniref:tRNA selenocysteine-associated protein 1 n=1 Tax=Operophtera brumata TaxID=104452 RepID=A0A0L7L3K6_OPEBR|nr:tRNA selenocysteine associated protein (Secp43) [Operophtera brumata]